MNLFQRWSNLAPQTLALGFLGNILALPMFWTIECEGLEKPLIDPSYINSQTEKKIGAPVSQSSYSPPTGLNSIAHSETTDLKSSEVHSPPSLGMIPSCHKSSHGKILEGKTDYIHDIFNEESRKKCLRLERSSSPLSRRPMTGFGSQGGGVSSAKSFTKRPILNHEPTPESDANSSKALESGLTGLRKVCQWMQDAIPRRLKEFPGMIPNESSQNSGGFRLLEDSKLDRNGAPSKIEDSSSEKKVETNNRKEKNGFELNQYFEIPNGSPEKIQIEYYISAVSNYFSNGKHNHTNHSAYLKPQEIPMDSLKKLKFILGLLTRNHQMIWKHLRPSQENFTSENKELIEWFLNHLFEPKNLSIFLGQLVDSDEFELKNRIMGKTEIKKSKINNAFYEIITKDDKRNSSWYLIKIWYSIEKASKWQSMKKRFLSQNDNFDDW